MSEFPAWAPEDVVRRWVEWEKTRLPESERDMLYRLLTYEDMEDVWQKVRTLDSRYFPCSVFTSIAIRGFRGPIGIEKKPPKELEKWQMEVKLTALKLESLIRGTDFDTIIADYLADKKLGSNLKRIEEGLSYLEQDIILGNLSVFLTSIARLIDNAEINNRHIRRDYHPPIKLKRPNSEEASRQYFVRAITKHFRYFFGQPYRRLTAITVTAAFDDPNVIIERQVIRMAP